MRTLICLCFAAIALQLHGQDQTPQGSYSGELPRNPGSIFAFRVSIGEFTATNGPVKMELVGRDLELQDDIITMRMPARRQGNRIRASFPFGGNYTGRYDPGSNKIVGRFGGFSLRGRPYIPRGRFEMTLVTN